jgi:hypothetical protein
MGAMKGFGAALAIAAIVLCAAPALGSAAVLYDQTDSPSGFGTFSQRDDAVDLQIADDFIVPSGQSWSLQSVDVDGAYDAGSSGPITSANVFLYADGGGLPGGQLFALQGVSPLNGTAGPDFTVPLTGSPQLASGAYWVSVQVNLPGAGTSIWDWQTRNAQSGSPRAVRSNGHPLPVCPGAQDAWITGSSCPIGLAPDQLFRLNGTVVPPTPVPAVHKECKKHKKHHSAQSAKKKKCKKKKRK